MQPAPFAALERTIGIHFANHDILKQALTHRSAVRGSRGGKHNERLEFLGDAVLELAATEFVFQFAEKSEGELTSWRSALVNGEHLAEIARELKLGEYLFMSRGEEASGGREKPSTLANAVEALIGAMYVDQGFEVCRTFCETFILSRLKTLLAKRAHKDSKSLFQEKAQELLNVTPHYIVEKEEGPDHDRSFTCAVFIGPDRIAEGAGNSKQRAEQAAAEAGLRVKGWF